MRILAELSELPDVAPPGGRMAFVEESMHVLLGLADSEPDIGVLVEVARAFGWRGDPRGARPLLGWRDHPDQRMRFFVAASLKSCRNDDNEAQVISALVELTSDEDGAVRDYALFGLRELAVDGAEVRNAMLRRVLDMDTSTAGEAHVGLAMLGDERGIDPLTVYLRDPAVPSDHMLSYGLEAATAHADSRLLPSLRALAGIHGELPSLTEAVRACTANPIP